MVIAQTGQPIPSQQERAIDINQINEAPEHKGRRDRQRRATHAADHETQPVRARSLRKRKRMRETARLIELNVDHLIASGRGFQFTEVQTGLISAQGYR